MATPDILGRCLFLIGRQRSGTTVLRQALASHPRVHDLGELMHERKPGGFYAELRARLNDPASSGLHEHWFDILLATIHSRAPADETRVLLIDMKYNSALNFGSMFVGPNLVNTLAHKLSQHKATVIHIVRRNKLALLASVGMARSTGQWRLRHDQDRRSAAITIEPRSLPSRIAAEQAMDAYFNTQLAAIGTVIPVVYEDLFMPDRTFAEPCFARVAQRFGLEPAFDLNPRLARQGLPLGQAIANFPAVAARIESLVAAGDLPCEYRTYLCA